MCCEREKAEMTMKKTILVVDDNSVERTMLQGFLSDDYKLLIASDGYQALEILHNNY